MLKTVDLALKVLMQFNENKYKWTVNELAAHFNENITKIYRICVTLENNNFLIKNEETKEYRLGLSIPYLANNIDNTKALKAIISPYLSQLTTVTNESTFFTIKKNHEGFILDSCECNNAIRFAVKVGSSAPLYAGATYRAILAFLEEEEREEILNNDILTFTDNSKSSKKEIEEHLRKIREEKVAISRGELTPDVVAIAVPILLNDTVIASLTVAGPSYRIKQENIEAIKSALLNIKKQIQSNQEFKRLIIP